MFRYKIYRSRKRGTPEKFWARVDVRSINECWPWKAGRYKDGYGQIRYLGQNVAHRVAYILATGPIPKDKIVRHTCDNPPCCNPAHFLLGTYQDNTDDRIARGRQATGDRSPRRLHPASYIGKDVGSRNPSAKLTELEVATIRQFLIEHPEAAWINYLALKFGVTAASIRLIKKKKIWKHVC